MKINGGPSMTGLQHMAAKAQESRKPARLTEPEIVDLPTSSTATEIPPAGKNALAGGNNLPPTPGTEQSAQKPDHPTGLERAIERLQQNAVKSPEAAGLQHALEMLQRNHERVSTVDERA